MGVFAVNQLVIFASSPTSENVVDFVGLQWYWISRNLDITLSTFLGLGDLLGLMASNLVVISGVSTFVLSAVDVIHAMAMPTTGLKLDAIPGRISVTRFEVDFTGVFAGQCSELCGALHGFMPVQLLVFRILP
jgi:cytochrome c oxidase subunit 2